MDVPVIVSGLSSSTKTNKEEKPISPTDIKVTRVSSAALRPPSLSILQDESDDDKASSAPMSVPVGIEMFKLQEKLRKNEIKFLQEAMTPEAFKTMTSRENSIMAHLESIYGEGKVTLKQEGTGFSEANKVIVKRDNGEVETVAILKRAKIPRKVWYNKTVHINQFLSHSKEELTLYEKLNQLFFEKPSETFNREDPHISSVKWGFLGKTVGEHLSRWIVPPTFDAVYIPYPKNQDWRSCGDKRKVDAQCDPHLRSEENCGCFSLQSFVSDAQPANAIDILKSQKKDPNKFDMESLQLIALFDMLTQAEDSNSGNILLKQNKEGIFHGIRIDHDPLFQPSYFDIQESRKIPCWMSWMFLIKEPLQEKVKKKIEALNPDEIISKSEEQGMLLDATITGKLRFNIQFFQDAIKNGPNHKLEELYFLFLKSGGKNDFLTTVFNNLTTISPSPSDLPRPPSSLLNGKGSL